MNTGKIFFFIFFLPLFMVSCIKEDLSNCNVTPELNLIFQYTGDGETDIFADRIEYVRLYIFEEDGKLVQEQELYQSHLDSYQGIRLNLPEGNYHIVCWGNALDNSDFVHPPDEGLYGDYKLSVKGYHTESRITTTDLLYYGVSKLSWKNDQSAIRIIPFVSAHIKMEVYVEGVDLTAPSSTIPYRMVRIRELDAQYNFDMEAVGKSVEFNPDTRKDITGKIALTTFNSLRFNNNNSIYIDIYNQEEKAIYSLSLKEFMKKNDISVEGKQEVTIPIYIKFTGVEVEVSIAEWDNTTIKPIF